MRLIRILPERNAKIFFLSLPDIAASPYLINISLIRGFKFDFFLYAVFNCFSTSVING
jgi:hypothetical protein